MIDLATLNPPQREAVLHGSGPLLVLAGAGSGKTRVITYRIANLIEHGVLPSRILAVTFTNKAAAEMLSRVSRLVHSPNGRPFIGTFHSTALRILRRYADRLGYTKSFVVYDTSDQMTLVRRSMRELNISDEAFPPRTVLSKISGSKNELQNPVEYEKQNTDFFGARISEVFKLYQKKLREFDAMDFDDLIGKFVELLEKHPDVREELHERFQHLLIDEYQDTNHAQYRLIKLLAGKEGNIVAVGDEDQSIYRFRGADINNILNFERDFPGARIIKLEQNYRSTGNILDAATGVVSNNVARKGKKLFTDAGSGEPVRIVTCDGDREEAQFVVGKIQELRHRMKLTDMAILFRTNAQSRPFEEELLRANLPYSVVGGVKFYERAEIKDLLSFIRLTLRPQDTPSIERVINVPSRGIGDTTVKALNEASESLGVSLWAVIEGELRFLPARAAKAVGEFREIIHDLQLAVGNPLPEFFDYLLLRTGYKRMFEDSRDPQDESRLQNIDELLNSAREYYENGPEATLGDYLDSLTLMSDLDRYEEQKGVTLMTLHAAKGLEFKVVFLTGMEEGILPHVISRKDNEEDDVEEERRLCYVGMTRAREQLYCVHCLQRRVHGQQREQSPSPFLTEIPEGAREEIRLARAAAYGRESSGGWREKPLRDGRWGSGGGNAYGGGSSYGSRQGSGSGSYSQPARSAPPRPSAAPKPGPSSAATSANGVFAFFKNAPVEFDPEAIRPASAPKPAGAAPEAPGGALSGELKRGQKVRHDQFGVGTILTMEGSGGDAKLTVYFDRAGTKKFIAKFAKLSRA